MPTKSTKHKPTKAKSKVEPTDDRGPALLALALEAPDDDTPRLVYADWLEEQGHAHAGVIRAQLGGDASQLANTRDAMTGPLAEWAIDPVFERGMLRRIYGRTNTYVQKATQASLLPLVSVFGAATTMLRGPCKKLGTAETLAWTTALFWWDCQLDDAQLADLVDSPHLHRIAKLDLEKVRCTDTGLRAVAKATTLPRLRHVGLPKPVHLGAYTAAGVLDVVDAHPIDSLSLTGVNRLAVDKLVQSQVVSKLRRLAVDSARHVGAVATSPHLAALEHLDLAVDPIHEAQLAPLLDHPTLRSLSVRLWCTTKTHALSAPIVEKLRAKFGAGFTYKVS